MHRLALRVGHYSTSKIGKHNSFGKKIEDGAPALRFRGVTNLELASPCAVKPWVSPNNQIVQINLVSVTGSIINLYKDLTNSEVCQHLK